MNDLLMNGKAQAAIYFTNDGQYVFKHVQEGMMKTKFVSARDAAAAFTGHDADSGWLPDGIVRVGYGKNGEWFVYVQPPQQVSIRIARKTGYWSLKIPIPGTLLVGAGNAYYLFCYESDQFHPNMRLITAPFPNVHENGAICFGSNNIPDGNPQNAPVVWKLFFEAPFNGDLVGGKCSGYPDDVRKLLRKLNGADTFPVDELLVAKRHAGQEIERILELN